jgi:hypothetical protein
MCALLRELIVPVGDLHRLAIECGQCKAVTVLDFTTRIKDEVGHLLLPVVTHCCVCHRDFDPGLKDRIRALGNLLDWMAALDGQTISFRVPPPPDHH